MRVILLLVIGIVIGMDSKVAANSIQKIQLSQLLFNNLGYYLIPSSDARNISSHQLDIIKAIQNEV
jgi:hypothetical protein